MVRQRRRPAPDLHKGVKCVAGHNKKTLASLMGRLNYSLSGLGVRSSLLRIKATGHERHCLNKEHHAREDGDDSCSRRATYHVWNYRSIQEWT